MHDEISHMRVVHCLLRLGLPGRIGGRIIRIDADEIELVQILEVDCVELAESAAKYEMEQLLGGCLRHGSSLASPGSGLPARRNQLVAVPGRAWRHGEPVRRRT